jgi:dGTPase
MSKAGQAGLNLTRRVLNAVLKYPWLRGEPSDSQRYCKWNAYQSEEKELRFARKYSAGDGKSVDAQVMDLADDIAYAVHDIEDAVRARMIPIDDLLKEKGEQREQFFDFVKQESKKTGLELVGKEVELVLNLIKKLCGESPLLKPYENSHEQRGALRRMTTILHRRYILAAHKGDGEDLQIDKRFHTELSVLKYLMYHFVFGALKQEQEALHKPIIQKLFRHYVGLARRDPKRLPAPAQWALESTGTGASEAQRRDAQIRAASDAVAGLTEDEALSLIHLVETGII